MGVRWRRCLWCFVFFLLGRHVPCGAVLVCSALLLLHNRIFCSEKTRTSHGIHLNATLVLVVNFKKILRGSGICPYLRKIWRICLWIWRSKHLHISLSMTSNLSCLFIGFNIAEFPTKVIYFSYTLFK